ncbi:alpha/beta fold hydrolase [Streptomyces sp. NPDC048172]|uniref:alpha/beta fold hydrolase n=1 Tax=Streptomyces sp. NPDC048172 TaxID=3365505 RepID=UPI00371EC33E
MERLSAATHLVASLEYLATERHRRPGGLNDWSVVRDSYAARSKPTRAVLDAVSRPAVTRALHVVAVGAALSLLAPTSRRTRLAANAALSGIDLVLHPRHHFGTDGADQVSWLVQTSATLARTGRNPRLADACLWFVALQSVLNYAASGYVKLAGPLWRDGDALQGIMRTVTYGDERTWRLLRRHPRVARALGLATLVMECTYPAVFLFGGRLAKPYVAAADAFHLANARLMALGRFLSAFGAMHPAVLYVTGAREKPLPDGRTERRDDLFPALCAGTAAAAGLALAVSKQRRRAVVRAGRGDEEAFTASSGNELSFRRVGVDSGMGPVLVFENGLGATMEHWERVVARVASRHPVITYNRAGYGRSTYADESHYRLAEAERDLEDLLAHVAPDRPVILAGHSLGGHLVWRTAARLGGERIRALCLVDSSHPGELLASERQRTGELALARELPKAEFSLRVGLGLQRIAPEWAELLPAHVRKLALAGYRDPGQAAALRREWLAAREDFYRYEGELPKVGSPVLVLSAQHAVEKDAEHARLQKEFAASAPRATHTTVEDAAHEDILAHPACAERVATELLAFVEGVTQHGH